MATLVLVHIGGAQKAVEIIGPDAGSYPRLIVEWPTAGKYVLDLIHNVLRVYDATHERRKALPWAAMSLEGAREIWKEMRTLRMRELRPNLRGIAKVKP